MSSHHEHQSAKARTGGHRVRESPSAAGSTGHSRLERRRVGLVVVAAPLGCSMVKRALSLVRLGHVLVVGRDLSRGLRWILGYHQRRYATTLSCPCRCRLCCLRAVPPPNDSCSSSFLSTCRLRCATWSSVPSPTSLDIRSKPVLCPKSRWLHHLGVEVSTLWLWGPG